MEMLHGFINWIVAVVGHWGYAGIYILMTLESTFVPIPSELILPPDGYLAFKGGMNIYLAVLAGTLGSMTGALINYFLAAFLGRPFILRYGKYVLCPPHKFEKVEKFFLQHGEVGTFTGRLIFGAPFYFSSGRSGAHEYAPLPYPYLRRFSHLVRRSGSYRLLDRQSFCKFERGGNGSAF
jgi:membrane protein DedA with SNARE-associated domain